LQLAFSRVNSFVLVFSLSLYQFPVNKSFVKKIDKHASRVPLPYRWTEMTLRRDAGNVQAGTNRIGKRARAGWSFDRDSTRFTATDANWRRLIDARRRRWPPFQLLELHGYRRTRRCLSAARHAWLMTLDDRPRTLCTRHVRQLPHACLDNVSRQCASWAPPLPSVLQLLRLYIRPCTPRNGRTSVEEKWLRKEHAVYRVRPKSNPLPLRFFGSFLSHRLEFQSEILPT